MRKGGSSGRGLVVGIVAASAIALVACSSDDSQPAQEPAQDASADALVDAGEEASLDALPDSEEAGLDAPEPIVELTVFATSDEHGWLQPFTDSGQILGGAANVMGWMAKDGLDVSKHLLVSSGDHWAGPAISSYFRGEPVVQAFNLMGYHASAIGNHEFDWGQEVLGLRMGEAHHKYLSANIRQESTGVAPDFIQRYLIVPVQGVKVGLIGVTAPNTATATTPKNVAGLVFDNIRETLDAVVPEVRGAGAEVVVVLAHEDYLPMILVAETTTSKADLILAGHGHVLAHTIAKSGTPVASSGSYWMAYTLAKLTYDRSQGKVTASTVEQREVAYDSAGPNPVEPDPEMESLVEEWQTKLDAVLGETIGYTETGIAYPSWAMGNWACDAWLSVVPDADVAVQNFGGLRQPVAKGPITKQTVFDVMPFENRLMQVQVTGAQLLENIKMAVGKYVVFGGGYPAVGGMTFTGTGDSLVITLKGGVPLDLAKTYKVLINDYMYGGGNNYLFGTQDPNAIDLGMNYRDPVLAWTEQLGSSSTDPLESHIDAAPRNQ